MIPSFVQSGWMTVYRGRLKGGQVLMACILARFRMLVVHSKERWATRFSFI